MGDPRVFFAAERTLLAWVRSGLTVMALGFVVARFGLFLTLLAASSVSPARGRHPHWSSALGIALVVLGAGRFWARCRTTDRTCARCRPKISQGSPSRGLRHFWLSRSW